MIREHPEGVVLDVRVTPRSTRTRVEGIGDGVIRVRLAAPPVDGAANAALVKLLASYFDAPKSAIEIMRGGRGRNKQVLVRGLRVQDALKRLESQSQASE